MTYVDTGARWLHVAVHITDGRVVATLCERRRLPGARSPRLVGKNAVAWYTLPVGADPGDVIAAIREAISALARPTDTSRP